MTPPLYNFIYSQLVRDSDDLVGLVAYSLYKREKIEFITKFKTDNGADPTEADLRVFHVTTNTDGRLKGFRDQAEGLLASFSTEILENQAEDLQNEYQQQLIQELKSAQPFWRGVWQNLAASVLTLALVALLFVVIWSIRIGPAEVISQIFNVNITDKGKSLQGQ